MKTKWILTLILLIRLNSFANTVHIGNNVNTDTFLTDYNEEVTIIRHDDTQPGKTPQLYDISNLFKGYYVDHCIMVKNNDSSSNDPYHNKRVVAEYMQGITHQDIDNTRNPIDLNILSAYADKMKLSIYQINRCRIESTENGDALSLIGQNWFPQGNVKLYNNSNCSDTGTCLPGQPPTNPVPINGSWTFFPTVGAIIFFLLVH